MKKEHEEIINKYIKYDWTELSKTETLTEEL